MSIKQLLEALTLWSQLKVDEIHVSDVYVRLGNDFNEAVAAFAAFGIDMRWIYLSRYYLGRVLIIYFSELMSVPDDLRTVLEQCLAEDATAENLEIYLPTVREIITNLLQGLRTKQSLYRRIVSEQRRGSEQAGSSAGHERNESRSSRAERSARTHRSQLSRTVAEGDRPERDSGSRRSAPSSGRRRDHQSHTQVAPDEDAFVGGFTPGLPEQSQSPSQPINEERISTFLEPPTRNHHEHVPEKTISPAGPYPETLSEQPPELPAESAPAVQSPPPSAVPPHVKRYSLVDKPVSPPAVVLEPSSPHSDHHSGPSTPPPDPPQELPPAMANSLAALQRSDVLERRASKRFSTFNISKMTGVSATRERSQRGHPNRRSLAVSSALTPGELAVLTEVDDEDAVEPPQRGAVSRARSKPRSATPERTPATPPVPPPPPPPPMTQEHLATVEASEQQRSIDNTPEPQTGASRITVFLQLGREVKKATLEPNITFASLRVLFVDKFSYNPGQDNFPAIYIRDPSSGVQYELENTEEVKEKCLLSLNIERAFHLSSAILYI